MKQKKDIIVIGMSTGGFEALEKTLKPLPEDFPAAIFVVWHMPYDALGILPAMINRYTALRADNAVDREPIKMGKIYCAPPDHHLIVERGIVRVTKGPKENRFRPAVDPLFRSAAYVYGSRVIGIVLSGGLDDGTAGLWTVKHHGGTAVVQDPQDAQVSSMPLNAMREVEVDYCLPAAQMPDLLSRLTAEDVEEVPEISMEEKTKTDLEVRIASEDAALEQGIIELGELSKFTCPDCHGVLLKIKDGTLVRFRCHTGHAFSADSLLSTISDSIEDSLWTAIRAVQESVMFLNDMSRHFHEAGRTELAEIYSQKANEAEQRANYVREAVLNHEHLSTLNIEEQSEHNQKSAGSD